MILQIPVEKALLIVMYYVASRIPERITLLYTAGWILLCCTKKSETILSGHSKCNQDLTLTQLNTKLVPPNLVQYVFQP